MTGEDVRKLSVEEIGVELKRLRDKLFQLRTQAVTEKVEDNSLFRKVRRDVARLMTEQTSRGAVEGGSKRPAANKVEVAAGKKKTPAGKKAPAGTKVRADKKAPAGKK
jgi:large subunit ribosomal protein L29